MPQSQPDNDALAKALIKRIRDAGAQQLNEVRLAKTASDNSRRGRVMSELVEIEGELAALSSTDRAEVERKVGGEFGVAGQFAKLLKEASIQALGQLSTYWSTFFAAVGIK